MWGALLVGVEAVRGGRARRRAPGRHRPGSAGRVRAGHRPAGGGTDAAAGSPLRREDPSRCWRPSRRSPNPPIRRRTIARVGAARLCACEGCATRYGTDGPWVLDGLDLDLVSGRSVAVVGRSGAGKSTLANVLLRFLPYEGGSVTLDGTPISDLLRRRVPATSSVSCPRTRTSSTRRSRRTFASPGGTRRRRSCVDALDAPGCWTGPQGLPAGLGTRVGAHGAQISGGQRQRLALARALLADFPVLVDRRTGRAP